MKKFLDAIKWFFAGLVVSMCMASFAYDASRQVGDSNPMPVSIGVSSYGASSSTITTVPVVINTQSLRFPMTVTVAPQSGVTATAEYSTTPGAASSPSTSNWSVLGAISGVSATNTVTLPSPVTALRFTRISGASAVAGELNW